MRQRGELRVVAAVLAGALLVLFGAHAFVQLAWVGDGPLIRVAGRQFYLGWLLDLSGERNIPAAYNATLYLLIAVLLHALSRSAIAAYGLAWRLLSFLFAFLSVDEAASVHERMNNVLFPALWSLLTEVGLNHSALRWVWVLPYAVGAVATAALSWRWWLVLDRFSRLCFAVGFILAVSGALGMEMLGSWRVHATYDMTGAGDEWRADSIYILLVAAEEVLEIAGLSLALFALVRLALSRMTIARMLALFLPGAIFVVAGVWFFPSVLRGVNEWLGADAYWQVVTAFALVMMAIVALWRGGSFGADDAAEPAGGGSPLDESAPPSLNGHTKIPNTNHSSFS